MQLRTGKCSTIPDSPNADCSCAFAAPRRDVVERSAVNFQHDLLPGVLLIPPNNAVGVLRIDLHEARFPVPALAGNQGAAGSSEAIRDNVSRLAAVEQCSFIRSP